MRTWSARSFDSQKTDKPVFGRPDNLFGPVPHDGGERGHNWQGPNDPAQRVDRSGAAPESGRRHAPQRCRRVRGRGLSSRSPHRPGRSRQADLRARPHALERLRARGLGQLDDVIHRALPEPVLQIAEAGGAAVADRRAQVLEHVVDRRRAPSRGPGTLTSMPSAPIASSSRGSASSRSRRSRTAPIDAIPRNTLNGTFTIFCDSGTSDRLEHDVARRLLGPGERAAQHHACRRRTAAPSAMLPSRRMPPSAMSGTRPSDRAAGTARAPRPAECRSSS